MREIFNWTTFCFFVLSIASYSENKVMKNNERMDEDSLIAKGAALKRVSNQFSFTEGASVDKKGNVFFTDQPNDKIWKYDTEGRLSVFWIKREDRMEPILITMEIY